MLDQLSQPGALCSTMFSVISTHQMPVATLPFPIHTSDHSVWKAELGSNSIACTFRIILFCLGTGWILPPSIALIELLFSPLQGHAMIVEAYPK